ncbi:MAG: PDZ domain-containing protein [Planctomycetota bacterium]
MAHLNRIRHTLTAKTALIAFCSALVAVVFAGDAWAQDIEAEMEKAIAKAIAKNSKSVLRLERIGGAGQFEGTRISVGSGTALVVDQDGWLLTSGLFVADEPASLIVTMPDGKRVPGELVARDRARNIAVLKIDPSDQLRVPVFVPRDKLSVGQTVIGIGCTIAVDVPQVSVGIISATDRIWGRAIQSDAKISPANFGGPLVDLDGNVVGILTPLSTRGTGPLAGMEWYDSGIGFAVPVTEILARFEDLKKGKDLHPGILGVNLQGSDIYNDPAKIAFTSGSSPAAKAGLRMGDTIIRCDGSPIQRQAQLKHAIGRKYAGDTVKLVVDNQDGEQELSVTLVRELPPFVPVGIGIAIDRVDQKLVVRYVDSEGPSAASGIEIGDQLDKVNRQPILNIGQLRTAIAATPENETITLSMLRGDEPRDVEITVGRKNAGIPESLPPIGLELKGEAEVAEIAVAEDANECFAILPPNSRQRPSLLVWLPPSGPVDQEQTLKKWAARCKEHNTIVLIPQSLKNERWDPQEVDFIGRAVNTLFQKRGFDRKRVVIGGRKNGATLASLVAFSNPTEYRGLVLDNAVPAKTISEIETSAVSPQMLLIAGQFPTDQDGNPTNRTLQKILAAQFPVQFEESLDPSGLMRWIRVVDRF